MRNYVLFYCTRPLLVPYWRNSAAIIAILLSRRLLHFTCLRYRTYWLCHRGRGKRSVAILALTPQLLSALAVAAYLPFGFVCVPYGAMALRIRLLDVIVVNK
jgi:hypothetical protein